MSWSQVNYDQIRGLNLEVLVTGHQTLVRLNHMLSLRNSEEIRNENLLRELEGKS